MTLVTLLPASVTNITTSAKDIILALVVTLVTLLPASVTSVTSVTTSAKDIIILYL